MSDLLLEELQVVNFRLYKEARFVFKSGLNVVLGPNGIGKTSLLEGVFVTLTGASFRTQRFSEMIRHTESVLRTRVSFLKQGVQQELALSHDGKQRRFQYNQSTAVVRSDILGLYPIVLFSQEDVALVKGAPQLRRRYLDFQLAQSDPLYCYHLGRYTRALRQRNILLRRAGRLDAIEAWEAILSGSGGYIVRQRIDLIKELQKRMGPVHEKIVGEKTSLHLKYRPTQLGGITKLGTASEIGALYAELYPRMRERERELGATLLGPHRDELSLLLEGKELRLYASDGQQKACAAALRFAEWESVHERGGVPPLMLIDDIGTSLDPKRRERLLQFAGKLGQVVVTAVGEAEVEALSVDQLIIPV